MHVVSAASWDPYANDFCPRVYDTLNRPENIEYVTHFVVRLNGNAEIPTWQCFAGWYKTAFCGPLGSIVTGSFLNNVWGQSLGNNYVSAWFSPNVYGSRNYEAWLSIDAPYYPSVLPTPTLALTPTPTLTLTPSCLPWFEGLCNFWNFLLDTFDGANGSIGGNWGGDTGGYSVNSSKLDVAAGSHLILWQTAYGAD
jgi:hypothetical protein